MNPTALNQTTLNPTTLYLIALAILILLAIFAVYIPNRREKAKKKKFMSSLKIGDVVVTLHGIRGRIESVDDSFVVIRSEPDGVKFEVAKWGIKEK
jgi:preprotein translocase subunit YajC